jgi:hypothetical protein
MQVRLRESQLTQELRSALESAGCTWLTVGGGEVRLVHESAADDREESIELAFFVRAWQAKHEVAGLGLDA